MAEKKKKQKRADDAVSDNARRQRSEQENGAAGQDILNRALPLLSVLAAFVAIVLFYNKLMPPAIADVATDVQEPAAAAPATDVQEYYGLQDNWVSSAVFTTGNKDLDIQVKDFCDALTTEGMTASENAQEVFNTIVWSGYEERTEEEKPMGRDWATVSARHYFDTGNPAEGIGGTGDAYEFAAAISYCLRYFGYSDALAIPVLIGKSGAGQYGSALVVVTDEDGRSCVCDPTLSADGWMLDRSTYNTILVEDIDQDLTEIEARGLEVQKNSTDESQSTSSNTNHSDDDGDNNDGQYDYNANNTDDSYGYGNDYSDYGSDYAYGYDYNYDYSYDYNWM